MEAAEILQALLYGCRVRVGSEWTKNLCVCSGVLNVFLHFGLQPVIQKLK